MKFKNHSLIDFKIEGEEFYTTLPLNFKISETCELKPITGFFFVDSIWEHFGSENPHSLSISSRHIFLQILTYFYLSFSLIFFMFESIWAFLAYKPIWVLLNLTSEVFFGVFDMQIDL